MKLLKTKWLSAIIFIVLLALSSSAASAAAPHVFGYVKNKDTGEGIPGMVVRWEDNADAQPNHGASNGVRYATTGADGKFFFPSWHLSPEAGGIGTEVLRSAEHNKRIDTDYNGSLDSNLVSDSQGLFFGCAENPHTFTLMLPRPGFDGQFAPQKFEVELINGNREQNVGTFDYTPTTPRCPTNIRHSCNSTATSATVTWNPPSGGATGYRLYYDRFPFGDVGQGDALHENVSNQLSRTFNITPNTDYLVRVRTVRDNVESESCLMQFKCNTQQDVCTNGCCPGEICPPPPCPDGNCPPTATLISCSQATDPYYAYTISNINTYGLAFYESRLMITFNLNAQTQRILNFLTNQSNSSTADFSLWNERNRQKQEGDYFGFYIQTFRSLNGNSLPYQISPNTRIGQKTMAEFRQFLLSENLPTQHYIKANMETRKADLTSYFNSHIPAAQRIDLSKEFSALCGTIVSDPTACPTITITKPAENEVLTPVNNRVTVQWSATGAQVGTEYEVLIYDKTAYSSPQQAYQAYLVGVAVPIAMPNNLKVYNTTSNSQIVNFGNINGMNPVNWMIAIRSKGLDADGVACAWTVREPAPPGFPVSGKIYEYNDACQPLVEVPIGGTITVSPSGQSIPVISGNFGLSVPQSEQGYALRLTLNSEDYTCANICGQGPSCVRDNITETNNTANFFVRTDNVFTNSWWQVFGGFVFAQNVINSELPITNENNTWRLMAQLIPGNQRTAGIPITNRDRIGNNAPDNTNVAGWLREPPLQVPSASITNPVKPNFDYFETKLGLPGTLLPDAITNPNQLNGQTRNGVVVHYKDGGTLTFAPTTTWNVSGNTHHVVLVRGDIVISAKNMLSGDKVVSTAYGSTTTFVASGTITIDGSVGNSNPASLAPNLSGIFIANQVIIQDDGNPSAEDKRFVGEGSFIGWNSISLLRQFDDLALNENTPSEAFLARPDFVINLPEVLRDSSITWKEVN